MKKAVATALVLIAGAAVVLWYGNTLNSYVLGGLIGGLAALLISIPISLTLFSYLSRRHDEHLLTQRYIKDQTFDDSFDGLDDDDFHPIPTHVVQGMYEVREAGFPASSIWDEDEEFARRTQSVRQLPAPSNRIPITEQKKPSQRLPVSQRSPSTTRPLSNRGNETGKRRITRKMNNPGFPGYQQDSMRSQFRSQALRTARLEAAQQSQDDDEVQELPVYPSRRPAPSRPAKPALPTTETDIPTRSPLEEPLYGAKRPGRRNRRPGDATPVPKEDAQFLPAKEERLTGQLPRDREPRRDRTDPSLSTGSLKKPLVRRAPYMYEDDPLRKELSQHVEAPITRRSTRNLSTHHEDE